MADRGGGDGAPRGVGGVGRTGLGRGGGGVDQRHGGRARGGGRGGGLKNANFMSGGGDAAPAAASNLLDPVMKERQEMHDKLEASMGYADGLKAIAKDPEATEKHLLGWLLNFATTSVEDAETGHVLSAIQMYFLKQDGCGFRATQVFAPYFYLGVRRKCELDVETYLLRRFEGVVAGVEHVALEDLDMKNHVSGARHTYLKVSFFNVQGLMEAKKEVLPAVLRNAAKRKAGGAGASAGTLGEGMTFAQLASISRPGASVVGAAATRDAAVKNLERHAGEAGRPALTGADALELVEELREYDVPYHSRWSIDTDVRCGKWYEVHTDTTGARGAGLSCALKPRPDLLRHAEPKVVAFDIETSKAPLQFPNSEDDEIFMISYMVNRQGYLIINREWVGDDVEDFRYDPRDKYPGPFKVFNERNERDLLQRWLTHMQEEQPGIYVTYNGDFFDWPFLEKRCEKHRLSLYRSIGFRFDPKTKEARSRYVPHLDAFCWVKRDSYLPQGSQGLKAVTKAKLGYDPVEVDPEDMVRFAREQPQTMAAYSVSDAVSTYYLYMTYVHPFIFALCTIMPLTPDEVLRKGSGTLCECLLMVQAYHGGIVCPNKHLESREKFYLNHPLDSETYIGGHVECLESGVFRSDLPTRFQLRGDSFQKLIDRVDEDLAYACLTEGNGSLPEDYENYDEVKAAIVDKLRALQAHKAVEEEPMIYHLDVSAMYPNIILTNRLQPMAVVHEEDCASCVYNMEPGAKCKRTMEWVWKGESFTATTSEYHALKRQLMSEKFPPKAGEDDDTPEWKKQQQQQQMQENAGGMRSWHDLHPDEQHATLTKRLKQYCQKVYKKEREKPSKEVRNATICMRENSFYIDTVRAFRDRRYEYKALNKKWKGKVGAAEEASNAEELAEAQEMVVLYDSLQLAHKCILNSFYGYVMRKGARWYSMEMAGVVTYAGAKIIQMAHKLVEGIGKPLELDTDGIWCCLPKSFPENFTLKPRAVDKDALPSPDPDGPPPRKLPSKPLKVSYPCAMLNALVAETNTNDQYQTLQVDPETKARSYKLSSEMSIEFEVDGPYRAMILPASKEEDKLIKKRYAVFNFDGSIAELKGFELKRRGELKLVKVFQKEIFDTSAGASADEGLPAFLRGTTLDDCYARVAGVANKWLDMLFHEGEGKDQDEVIEWLSESCTMSKSLEQMGDVRGTAVTCARRLSEFLGDESIKERGGLNCTYIIAKQPLKSPTSERAIPVSIFQADASVCRAQLKRWLKLSELREIERKDKTGRVTMYPDVRAVIDWDYYITRLGSAVQKIITIPAAMQMVANPVPRIPHPDWLARRVREKNSKSQQMKLVDFFAEAPANTGVAIEELGPDGEPRKPPRPQDGEGGAAAADGGAVADMEDLVRPRVAPAAAAPAAPEPAEPEPDRYSDYDAWLKWKTTHWRTVRKARKKARDERERERRREQMRAIGANSAAMSRRPARRAGDGAGGLTLGLASFFQSNDAAFVHSAHWQVLAVEPGLSPACAFPSGDPRFSGANPYFSCVSVWVLSATDLRCIPVAVPHVVYLETPHDLVGSSAAHEALALMHASCKRTAADNGIAGDDPSWPPPPPPRRVTRVPPGGCAACPMFEVHVPALALGSGGGYSAAAATAAVQQLLNDMDALQCLAEQGKDAAQALSSGDVVGPSGTPVGRRGAYGLAVPPLERVIHSVGCVCHASVSDATRVGFSLDELRFESTTSHSYLEPAAIQRLKCVSLRLVVSADGSRGMFVLSLPSAKKGIVCVVSAGGASITASEVTRAMRNAARRARDEGGDGGNDGNRGGNDDDAFTWDVMAANTVDSGASKLGKALSRLKAQEAALSGPTFAIVEGAPLMSLARLRGWFPALAHVPVLRCLAPAAARFPSLDWQRELLRKNASQVAEHAVWFQKQVGLARYAHVPVGNLADAPPSAAHGVTAASACHEHARAVDVVVGRSIVEGGHCLWFSAGDYVVDDHIGGGTAQLEDADARRRHEARLGTSTDRPSGGARTVGGGTVTAAGSDPLMLDGASNDAACGVGGDVLNLDAVDFGNDRVFVYRPEDQSELGKAQRRNDASTSMSKQAVEKLFMHGLFEVCQPGAYRSVCVEVRCCHLCVAALLRWDELDACETFGQFGGGSDGAAGSASPASIRVLARIVGGWLEDASLRHTPEADELLQTVDRWVMDPDGGGIGERRCLPPPVCRKLRSYVRTLASLLVCEFRSLDLEVVHAEMDRFTLCTGRKSLSEALRRVHFALDTLRTRKDGLFRWVRWLGVTQVWHALLLRDKYNFGGVVAGDDEVTAGMAAATAAARADATSGAPPTAPPPQTDDGDAADEQAGNSSEEEQEEDEQWMMDAHDTLGATPNVTARKRRPRSATGNGTSPALTPRRLAMGDGDAPGADGPEAQADADAGELANELRDDPDDDADLLDPMSNPRKRSAADAATRVETQVAEAAIEAVAHAATPPRPTKRLRRGRADVVKDVGRLDASAARRRIDEVGNDDDDDDDDDGDDVEDLPQDVDGDDADRENAGGTQSRGAAAGPRIQMAWSMADYLPEALQEAFHVLVGEFIYRSYRRYVEYTEYRLSLTDGEPAAGGEAAAKRGRRSSLIKPRVSQYRGRLSEAGGAIEGTPTQAANPADVPQDESNAAVERRGVRNDVQFALSEQLVRLVNETNKVVKSLRLEAGEVGGHGHAKSLSYPRLAGSHLSPKDMGHPALALAKSVLEVFHLDARCTREVGILRSTLLRLCHERDYTPVSYYRDPCAVVLVRGMRCTSCGAARDIDLCRDERVRRGDWSCPRCEGGSYESAAAEAVLLGFVDAEERRFSRQDVLTKPGFANADSAGAGVLGAKVASGRLARLSDRTHKLRIPTHEHIDNLKVLVNVAAFHGMDDLRDTCTALLAGDHHTDDLLVDDEDGADAADAADARE